jgi:hypothetical protein
MPLRNVIFSLRMTAAKIKAKIGFVEMIMDEFTGEVKFSPTRKSTWLITTPKNEQPKR